MFLTAVALLTVLAQGGALAQDGATAAAARQHGVGWVAGRRIDSAAIAPLVEHSIGWIAQTPFGWQAASDSPEIRLVVEGQVLWGETDEGLRETTQLARASDIQTMLKPHIWVGGKGWRGDIQDVRRASSQVVRFTPQNKLAADVMSAWYSGAQ